MAASLHLPHQLASANKTLTAQCHCKSAHFTVTVPTSALPLPVHLCHCSICRYTHGTFSCFHAPLPSGVEPEFVAPSSIESSLTGYIHSPQAAAERFFCSTCGCHIGDRDLKPDPETGKPEWRVATSIFTAHGEDTFQMRSHCFTTPAMEPNLATWLPSVNSRAMHVWNPDRNDPDFPLATFQPAVPPAPGNDTGNDGDVLVAQCHCAGVRFALPAYPSPAEASDPFLSRVLRPSATAAPTSQHRNVGDEPSGRATGPEVLKRVACVCVCSDCRLVSGAHAVPWTFVPLASLRPAVPAGFEGFGTLRCYRSSERVRRGFCGVCGATMLYAVDDPDRVSAPAGGGEEEEKRIVDVALGVLRDPRGKIAAEEWVTWRTGRLAGWKSGTEFDKGFAEGLAKGLAEWGDRRYGGTVNFNIPQN